MVPQWIWFSTIIYTVASYFTKVTLILLIARAFSVKRNIALRIYAIILVFTLTFVLLLVFKIISCIPINSYWDSSVQARFCIDRGKLWLSETIYVLVSDLAVMLLPVPLVVPLRIPLGKKVKIGVLLGVGGIANMASGYRVVLMVAHFTDPDVTAFTTTPAILALVELTIGFVCACVPPITIVIERNRHKTRESQFNTPRSRLYKRMGSHSGGSTGPQTTITTMTGITTQHTGRDDGDDEHHRQLQASTSRADADFELEMLRGQRSPPGLNVRSQSATADTEATGGIVDRNPSITWADNQAEDWPSSRPAAKKWRFPYIGGHRAPPTSSESMGGIMRTIEITLETAVAGESPDDEPPGADSSGGQSNSRGLKPPLVTMTRAAAKSRAKTVHARIWDGKSHDLGTRAIGYSQ
ncbi:hypothetical protein PspLS_10669 [Pyricularia sp. CBS 133598]|nr:hypothetical protein PspLS_10669 [Pyricularia sp. CBS 133598]